MNNVPSLLESDLESNRPVTDQQGRRLPARVWCWLWAVIVVALFVCTFALPGRGATITFIALMSVLGGTILVSVVMAAYQWCCDCWLGN